MVLCPQQEEYMGLGTKEWNQVWALLTITPNRH